MPPKRCIGKDNPVSSYRNGLDSVARQRYDEKLDKCGGADPFELHSSLFSSDPADFPDIKSANVKDYFTTSKCHKTGQTLNVQRGMESYELSVVGYVDVLEAMYLEHLKTYIIRGKIRSSHQPNSDRHCCWCLVLKSGVVLSGHCTCMAGLGEFCAHVGATLHSVAITIENNGISCTSRKNSWIIPPTMDITAATIQEIDFTATKRLLKEASLEENTGSLKRKKGNQSSRKMHEPSSETVNEFLSNLNNLSNGQSAVLKVLECFMSETKTCEIVSSVTLPGSFLNFFDENLSKLNYLECLNDSMNFVMSVKISNTEAEHIEQVTKLQSQCQVWFDFRAGRVTGSKIASVCRTSPLLPALGLLKSICYPLTSKFQSKATQYGIEEEAKALLMYKEKTLNDHAEFDVKACGLFVNRSKPFIASSPDGLISCECCGKGVLEIKCPIRLKNKPLSDYAVLGYLVKNKEGDFLLKKNHEYFYQIQNHLLCVEGAKYCDFVVYTIIDLIVIRIIPDKDFQHKMITKSEAFFVRCILPELRAHAFSKEHKPRLALAPLQQNLCLMDTHCYCQTENSTADFLICDNLHCEIKKFHPECFKIAKKEFPKKWHCPDCHRKKWKR